jgi:hypothetical protein
LAQLQTFSTEDKNAEMEVNLQKIGDSTILIGLTFSDYQQNKILIAQINLHSSQMEELETYLGTGINHGMALPANL